MPGFFSVDGFRVFRMLYVQLRKDGGRCLPYLSNHQVVYFFFILLSMLHYRVVILHAGLHLCFCFVMADAVAVLVNEFPLQLQLLQRLLRT